MGEEPAAIGALYGGGTLLMNERRERARRRREDALGHEADPERATTDRWGEDPSRGKG